MARMSATPDTSSHLIFPPAAMAAAASIDVNSVTPVMEQIGRGEEAAAGDFQKLMVSMMLNMSTTFNKLDTRVAAVEADVNENSEKIKALEDKVGSKEECSIPLSIVIHNLKTYNGDDENTVKKVIQFINAEGVNAETDVKKVQRKGYKPATATQSERHGVCRAQVDRNQR